MLSIKQSTILSAFLMLTSIVSAKNTDFKISVGNNECGVCGKIKVSFWNVTNEGGRGTELCERTIEFGSGCKLPVNLDNLRRDDAGHRLLGLSLTRTNGTFGILTPSVTVELNGQTIPFDNSDRRRVHETNTSLSYILSIHCSTETINSIEKSTIKAALPSSFPDVLKELVCGYASRSCWNFLAKSPYPARSLKAPFVLTELDVLFSKGFSAGFKQEPDLKALFPGDAESRSLLLLPDLLQALFSEQSDVKQRSIGSELEEKPPLPFE